MNYIDLDLGRHVFTINRLENKKDISKDLPNTTLFFKKLLLPQSYPKRQKLNIKLKGNILFLKFDYLVLVLVLGMTFIFREFIYPIYPHSSENLLDFHQMCWNLWRTAFL